MQQTIYDVIVVGGGHAGTEAALAAARMGASTLLLTHSIDTLGQMSCNPAIGGIGKGHLVKEIDALGGAMASAIDCAGIHFRTLNASKGPAVQATRAQADRELYKQAIRSLLETQENLSLFQQPVDDILIENGNAVGVVTQMGLIFKAKTIVLTVGTFLGGKIHIGGSQYSAGRAGAPASTTLAKRLRALPFKVDRLKTGTPPRIDGRTLDYTAFQSQPGDTPTPVFSFMGHVSDHPHQIDCFIASTNEATHDIIRANLAQSPMYNGQIDTVGPRYCPSIEDKIVRFADKKGHQIFIEPEGLNTHEIYPNGISTSLPFEIQQQFVRAMPGFEKAHITRPGYAIEYDFFDPRGLTPWLETQPVAHLFFAGQINGTTGYEEAGAQGLIAGINAALKARSENPWYPRRNEAYIGVLLDDLVTCGTQEPYRMFTSRAEYRLILREDNADVRLTEQGRKLGLVSDKRWEALKLKQTAIKDALQQVQQQSIKPGSDIAQLFEEKTGQPLTRDYKCIELLKRPEIGYTDYALVKATLQLAADTIPPIDDTVAAQVIIQAKYAGYIARQQDQINKQARHETTALSPDLDYTQIPSLSNEVKQKLSEVQPLTIGQASRIPGVTPAAIALLLVYIKH